MGNKFITCLAFIFKVGHDNYQTNWWLLLFLSSMLALRTQRYTNDNAGAQKKINK